MQEEERAYQKSALESLREWKQKTAQRDPQAPQERAKEEEKKEEQLPPPPPEQKEVKEPQRFMSLAEAMAADHDFYDHPGAKRVG